VDPAVIGETMRSFAGVEHRIEKVDEYGGVRFINDSKGTNPDAAIKAVEAMKVLIRAQMLEVRRAEKDVEAARRRLHEAMQERKIHEKLREHAFEAFVEELEKEESKSVDELVSYSYSTK